MLVALCCYRRVFRPEELQIQEGVRRYVESGDFIDRSGVWVPSSKMERGGSQVAGRNPIFPFWDSVQLDEGMKIDWCLRRIKPQEFQLGSWGRPQRQHKTALIGFYGQFLQAWAHALNLFMPDSHRYILTFSPQLKSSFEKRRNAAKTKQHIWILQSNSSRCMVNGGLVIREIYGFQALNLQTTSLNMSKKLCTPKIAVSAVNCFSHGSSYCSPFFCFCHQTSVLLHWSRRGNTPECQARISLYRTSLSRNPLKEGWSCVWVPPTLVAVQIRKSFPSSGYRPWHFHNRHG